MLGFETWFNDVLYKIVATLENDELKGSSNVTLVARALYSQIHLHGIGEVDADPELAYSLVNELSLQPSMFAEAGWTVAKDHGETLILRRRNIEIKAPKDHACLVREPETLLAEVRRPRRTLAVMPGWDRIVSAYGWPKPGDARIYLPTVSNSGKAAELVEVLDTSSFQWHIKTTRLEGAKRPDSVVLYVRNRDINEVVELINGIIPAGTSISRIPGFSVPHNGSRSVGVGLVRPESSEASYGWSFATDLAMNLLGSPIRSSPVEDQARSALERLVQDASGGKIDVKIPW